MSKKTATADVICLHPAHQEKAGSPQKSGHSGIFSEGAHNTPKKKKKLKYGSKENQPPISMKQCRKDIKSLSATQLRKKYPTEYSSHRNMKSRCKDKGNVLHSDFVKFPDFLVSLGPKPDSTFTLDRIDHNNPEYSPANTRWASKALQTANRKNTKYVTDNAGNCLSVTEWSRQSGLIQSTIRQRLKRGWSQHDAVHTPNGGRRRSSSTYPHCSRSQRQDSQHSKIWERGLREHHKQHFVSWSGKNNADLNNAARAFSEHGLHPELVFEVIVRKWLQFTEFAENLYGAFGSPTIPTIEYLNRHLAAAGNFYFKHREAQGQTRIEGVRKHRAAELEKDKDGFISEYMCRDDEYKEVCEALVLLRERENSQGCGVTYAEGVAYQCRFGCVPENNFEVYGALRDDLETEEEEIRNSKGLLLPALRAWTAHRRDPGKVRNQFHIGFDARDY